MNSHTRMLLDMDFHIQNGALDSIASLYRTDPTVLRLSFFPDKTSTLAWAAKFNQAATVEWIFGKEPQLIVSRDAKGRFPIEYSAAEVSSLLVEKTIIYLSQEIEKQNASLPLKTYIECNRIIASRLPENLHTQYLKFLQTFIAHLKSKNDPNLQDEIAACEMFINRIQSGALTNYQSGLNCLTTKRRQRHLDAIYFFKQALSLSHASDQMIRLESYGHLIDAYIAVHDVKSAATVVDQAILEYPNVKNFTLAQSIDSLGRKSPQLRMICYRQALNVCPEESNELRKEICANFALTHLDVKDLNDAIYVLGQAQRYNLSNLLQKLFYEIAILYFKKGSVNEAISYFQSSLQAPSDYRGLRTSCYLHLLTLYEYLNELHLAEITLNKALAENLYNPISLSQACEQVGNNLFQKYKNREAITFYKFAISFCPVFNEVYRAILYARLIHVYRELQDFKTASETYQSALNEKLELDAFVFPKKSAELTTHLALTEIKKSVVASTQAASLVPATSAAAQLAPIAGIAAKYTNQSKLPHLSGSHASRVERNYTLAIRLTTLQTQATTQSESTVNALASQPKTLKTDSYEFDHYVSADSIITDDTRRATFVFAGRGQNAYIPASLSSERVIIVISEKQIDELKNIIPSFVEVIVIKSMQSKSHGKFSEEQLGLITARRLAAFLCADAMGLDHFLVLDDNIAEINFNYPETDVICEWSALHKFFQNALATHNTLSCSLQSKSGASTYQAPSHNLGCKIFYYDLKSIKEKIKTPEQFFYLLPPATCANWPLEDYYLQLCLTAIFESSGKKGYYTLPMEVGIITRAINFRNSCVSVVGKLEDTYQSKTNLLEEITQSEMDADLLKCIEKCYAQLLKIIRNNEISQNKKRKFLTESDLSVLQALTQTTHASEAVSSSMSASASSSSSSSVSSSSSYTLSISSPLSEITYTKKTKFTHHITSTEQRVDMGDLWGTINQQAADLVSTLSTDYPTLQLREPQKDNLKAILQSACKTGYSEIAQGVGKTLIQFILCDRVFKVQQHLAHARPIIVVLQNINLLKQSFHAFEAYKKKFSTSFSFVMVSSDDESLPVRLLNMNTHWQTENQVMLVCLRSYIKYLEYLDQSSTTLSAPSMMLLDELHLFSEEQIRQIISHAEPSKIPIFAYTATMQEAHKNLFTNLYQYDRSASVQASLTAPLVVEKISPSDFQRGPLQRKEDSDSLWQNESDRLENILRILKYKAHPNGEPLQNYKGIIFEKSIEAADKLQKYLSEHNVPAISIHCKLKKNANHNDFNIIIAVDMLKSGFDNNEIYWIINLQKGLNPVEVAQVACRANRINPHNPHKIGYVMVLDTADISKLAIEPIMQNATCSRLFASTAGYRSGQLFSDTPHIFDTIIRNHAAYLKSSLQNQNADDYLIIGRYHLFGFNSEIITKKILQTLCEQLNLSYEVVKNDPETIMDYVDFDSDSPTTRLIAVKLRTYYPVAATSSLGFFSSTTTAEEERRRTLALLAAQPAAPAGEEPPCYTAASSSSSSR